MSKFFCMCTYNHVCTGIFEGWENNVKIAFDRTSLLFENVPHQVSIMHSVIAYYMLVSTLTVGVIISSLLFNLLLKQFPEINCSCFILPKSWCTACKTSYFFVLVALFRILRTILSSFTNDKDMTCSLSPSLAVLFEF